MRSILLTIVLAGCASAPSAAELQTARDVACLPFVLDSFKAHAQAACNAADPAPPACNDLDLALAPIVAICDG